VDGVVATVVQDSIVAWPAIDEIVSAPIGHLVSSPSAVCPVVPVEHGDPIVTPPGVDEVVSGAGADDVPRLAGRDDIVASQSHDDVAAWRSNDAVSAVRSDNRGGMPFATCRRRGSDPVG
jgi:hypothetical protein